MSRSIDRPPSGSAVDAGAADVEVTLSVGEGTLTLADAGSITGRRTDVPEPTLDKKFKHDIDVVVDRIVVKPDLGNRLADSMEIALQLTDGIAVAEMADGKKEAEPEKIVFSSRFACPESGFTIDEIEPRLFSFNNPFGACPSCDGLGTQFFIDPEAIVPDQTLSLRKGAIVGSVPTRGLRRALCAARCRVAPPRRD